MRNFQWDPAWFAAGFLIGWVIEPYVGHFFCCGGKRG